MKYQFTTEGSKPQTKYHNVWVYDSKMEEPLFKCIVSTPLTGGLLSTFLRSILDKTGYGLELSVRQEFSELPSFKECGFMYVRPIGLDTIARILSNVKPLTVKVKLTIDGDSKVYSIDADKLDTLLKSLE